MDESDRVSLHVDLLKFGFVVLIAVVGWLLATKNAMDWWPDKGAPDYGKSAFFLGFSALFWAGWSFVVQRSLGCVAPEKERTEHPIRRLGLGSAHWWLSATALSITAFAVFDNVEVSSSERIGTTLGGVFLVFSPWLFVFLRRARGSKTVSRPRAETSV